MKKNIYLLFLLGFVFLGLTSCGDNPPNQYIEQTMFSAYPNVGKTQEANMRLSLAGDARLDIQEETARMVSKDLKKKGFFDVVVYGWNSIERRLIQNPIVLYASFPYFQMPVKIMSNEIPKYKSENAGRSIKPVRFAGISIMTEECLWREMSINKNPHFILGTHQLPICSLADEEKVSDPVFDVSLINNMKHPVVVTHIGFRAIAEWTKMKGLPVSGKIKQTDGYAIEVHEFVVGNTEWLKLDDPIYMEGEAPYRFKFRLRKLQKRRKG